MEILKKIRLHFFYTFAKYLHYAKVSPIAFCFKSEQDLNILNRFHFDNFFGLKYFSYFRFRFCLHYYMK